MITLAMLAAEASNTIVTECRCLTSSISILRFWIVLLVKATMNNTAYEIGKLSRIKKTTKEDRQKQYTAEN